MTTANATRTAAQPILQVRDLCKYFPIFSQGTGATAKDRRGARVPQGDL
jgi:hypothetical protein